MLTATVVLSIFALGLTYLSFKLYRSNSSLKSRLIRYSGLSSVEDEIERRRTEISTIEATLKEMAELHALAQKEYLLYASSNEMAGYGFYPPQYDFATAKDYATKAKEQGYDVATDSPCGKSLDMVWLAQKEWQVTGVEASRVAFRAFFEENKIEFTERIRLWCGDFF